MYTLLRTVNVCSPCVPLPEVVSLKAPEINSFPLTLMDIFQGGGGESVRVTLPPFSTSLHIKERICSWRSKLFSIRVDPLFLNGFVTQ